MGLGNRKVQSIATAFYPNPGLDDRDWERSRPNQMAATVAHRCRDNTWTMLEFHDYNGNGFGDIRWRDKLIYFSSIDRSIDAMDLAKLP